MQKHPNFKKQKASFDNIKWYVRKQKLKKQAGADLKYYGENK